MSVDRGAVATLAALQQGDLGITGAAPDGNWPELALEARHGLVGQFLDRIEEHTEADPAALAVGFLTAYGNVIGRTAHVLVEADRHHGNLFSLIVGETSVSRKTTAKGQSLRPFGVADPEWSMNRVENGGLSSGEGLIWRIRDPISKTVYDKRSRTSTEVVEDQGVADKRLLVVESEFGSTLRVLERQGNTLSPVLRAAWDGDPLSTLTKNSPAKATGPHVSILGNITIEELRRNLNRAEIANGLINRFLIICAKRSKLLPDGGQGHLINWGDISGWLRKAVEHALRSKDVSRSPAARELWHELYPRLSEGGAGLSGAATSRGAAQVVRLSLLYALLDLSAIVEPEHLAAAVAIWDYAEASARLVFGGAFGDPDADTIRTALFRAGTRGLTRTEIVDLFGRHRPAGRISRALEQLLLSGLAHPEGDLNTGGRPAERWIADPPQEKGQG